MARIIQDIKPSEDRVYVLTCADSRIKGSGQENEEKEEAKGVGWSLGPVGQLHENGAG
jgi:hypothetical protein